MFYDCDQYNQRWLYLLIYIMRLQIKIYKRENYLDSVTKGVFSPGKH